MDMIFISMAAIMSLSVVGWLAQWGRKNVFAKYFVYTWMVLCGLGCLFIGGVTLAMPKLYPQVPVPEDGMILARMLLMMAGLPFVALIRPVRRLLGKTIFPGLDATVPAHTWALYVFLSALVVTYTFIRDLYKPDVIIESLQAMPLSISASMNAVSFVVFAFLAYGIWIYKPFRETAVDLGFTRLPWKTVGLMVIASLLLAVGIESMESAITPLVSPQQLSDLQRVVSALKPPPGVVPVLSSAALVGLAAGVGEETLFRGMMQPIFGIVPTALLFTLIHTHYGFTFFLVELFIVGLILGIIRQRLNTTAAIIVHSGFDFFVLASSLLHHS